MPFYTAASGTAMRFVLTQHISDHYARQCDIGPLIKRSTSADFNTKFIIFNMSPIILNTNI